jgi:hypothetical protein
MVSIAVLVFVAFGHAQETDATASKAIANEAGRVPEMQKLYDAFIGTWQVTEAFEISSERQGKTRQGTASFRMAPGPLLIEEYRSNGSAGSLNALSFLWWDEAARIYRFLTCANDDGCQLRGTAKWEGKQLVNSWQEKVEGKTAVFRDSFEDISPSSFRVVSEGKVDGKTIWRVLTKHERLNKNKN